MGLCFHFESGDPEHRTGIHDPQVTESRQVEGQLQFSDLRIYYGSQIGSLSIATVSGTFRQTET